MTDKQKLMQQEAWLLKDKHGGVQSREFETDKRRLYAGEPLAYIIGWIPFLDTKIYLDSYPLIPRPETEFWVRRVIEEAQKNSPEQLSILDLCAGSGCIGIAFNKTFPDAEVDFVEIEEKHHAMILKNIEENDVAHTGAILGGDLFEHVTATYDLILSNPPYINQSLGRTDASVHEYEPHSALYADNKGMALIARIIPKLKSTLNPNGCAYIEHEPEHVEAIHTLTQDNDLRVETFSDQYNVARYSKFTVAQ